MNRLHRLLLQIVRLVLPELVRLMYRWARKRGFLKQIMPLAERLVKEATLLAELDGPQKQQWVALQLHEWIDTGFPEFAEVYATSKNLNWVIETTIQQLLEEHNGDWGKVKALAIEEQENP